MAGDAADVREKPSRKRQPERRPARSPVARNFYGSALDAAEQIEQQEAAEVEGLDEEIAVLRVRLRNVLKEHPEDYPLMMRGVELLVKAVSARYRLSKEAEEDLAGHLAGVIQGVGAQLMPEGFAHD